MVDMPTSWWATKGGVRRTHVQRMTFKTTFAFTLVAITPTVTVVVLGKPQSSKSAASLCECLAVPGGARRSYDASIDGGACVTPCPPSLLSSFPSGHVTSAECGFSVTFASHRYTCMTPEPSMGLEGADNVGECGTSSGTACLCPWGSLSDRLFDRCGRRGKGIRRAMQGSWLVGRGRGRGGWWNGILSPAGRAHKQRRRQTAPTQMQDSVNTAQMASIAARRPWVVPSCCAWGLCSSLSEISLLS
jgi:hypothetical protein